MDIHHAGQPSIASIGRSENGRTQKRGLFTRIVVLRTLKISIAAICWRGMGCIGFENTQVFLYTPCTE